MPVKVLVSLINFYQFVKRGFPPVCRFVPSCSQYMKESLVKYGLFKGLSKGFFRILKCHPYHKGGYDPLD